MESMFIKSIIADVLPMPSGGIGLLFLFSFFGIIAALIVVSYFILKTINSKGKNKDKN